MAEDQRLHRTWLHSERTIPSRFVRPALKFTHTEAAGGVVLLIAAVAALVWANAPFGDTYDTFWGTHLSIELAGFHFDESLKHIVNDALMAIFFFVVGLEVKRELVVGELNTRKKAMLPAIAALGGMAVPALIYVGFVSSAGGEALSGWGIPMATDIAFSIGVVSLLGRRVPIGAKLFLLALAIADDIGAIAVIAIFYTTELALGWLVAALGGFGVIWLARQSGIRSMAFYTVAAIAVWFFTLESGIHATLAGVALGLMTPVFAMYSDEDYRRRATWILDRYEMDAASPEAPDRLDENALALAAIARESVAPLERLENALHPWSSFVIVPLFALANAGIRFEGIDVVDTATSSVALGVAFGLVIGKLFGISLATWLAVRFGLGELPRRTTWSHVVGLAALAGIGFTVSLFITELAFTDELISAQAKVGIFVGSAVAGVIGYLVLRRQHTPEESLEAARAAMTAGVPGQ
jgi:NhaA family Na+:H+ antiporter